MASRGGETERNTAAEQPAGARMGSLLLTNGSFSEKTLSAPHRVARSNTYPGPNAMHVTIAVVGCLDTKGEEVQFLKSVIEGEGPIARTSSTPESSESRLSRPTLPAKRWRSRAGLR
jgi:hypothetical protein